MWRLNHHCGASSSQNQVLGELRAHGGQYSQSDLQVVSWDRPLQGDLAAALTAVVGEGEAAGLRWRPAARGVEAERGEALPAGSAHKEGAFLLLGSGGLARVEDGCARPYQARPARDAGELRNLIRLRDGLVQLLELEASGADDVACDRRAGGSTAATTSTGTATGRSTGSRRCAPAGPIPAAARTSSAVRSRRWGASATTPTTAACWPSFAVAGRGVELLRASDQDSLMHLDPSTQFEIGIALAYASNRNTWAALNEIEALAATQTRDRAHFGRGWLSEASQDSGSRCITRKRLKRPFAWPSQMRVGC